ncbi:hypothetical protein BDZ85DRAFT_257492 [Elsinoe ampelina]|uniref:Uncharacterized protein n=1 Tax=Elsinoe ampelina TaxID=302913 RepID=A0A6A6GI78_9PEZI|nr:hypothetical protein BDZ85DRAFT_257492 [Elsinoe ampelina]
MARLTDLPIELILSLPRYLHNIEDFTSLSSTNRKLHSLLPSTSPNTILQLCAAQSTTFFRPSPHFLLAALAPQLGSWARLSPANEALLAETCQSGIEALLPLCLSHCGLTLPRIRELHALRFSTINPITNIIDQCVGAQWSSTADFWDGGVDDAYTICADADETFFHLAIYGGVFGGDFGVFLSPEAKDERRLSVATRLEFIKYCMPDFAMELGGRILARGVRSEGGTMDPRRDVKPVGPYQKSPGTVADLKWNSALGMTWVLKSSRWTPCWKKLRELAGGDFDPNREEEEWHADIGERDWRQRMWENVMLCQGLDGLQMILPEHQEKWVDKVKLWRDQVADILAEPGKVKVGLWETYEYPWLFGDLTICTSGYVMGT